MLDFEDDDGYDAESPTHPDTIHSEGETESKAAEFVSKVSELKLHPPSQTLRRHSPHHTPRGGNKRASFPFSIQREREKYIIWIKVDENQVPSALLEPSARIKVYPAIITQGLLLVFEEHLA